MIGYEDCTHHQEIRSCQISTVCALKTKTYGYIWANGEFASKGWELEHQQSGKWYSCVQKRRIDRIGIRKGRPRSPAIDVFGPVWSPKHLKLTIQDGPSLWSMRHFEMPAPKTCCQNLEVHLFLHNASWRHMFVDRVSTWHWDMRKKKASGTYTSAAASAKYFNRVALAKKQGHCVFISQRVEQKRWFWPRAGFSQVAPHHLRCHCPNHFEYLKSQGSSENWGENSAETSYLYVMAKKSSP